MIKLTFLCARFISTAEQSIYITTNSVQLGAVENIEATDGDNDQITVFWNSVTNAAYYDVPRADSDLISEAALIGITSSISFTDTNVIPFYTYTYWVRAYRKDYLDGEFSEPDTGYAD